MKRKITPIIFWILFANFIFLILQFTTPCVRNIFRGSPVFLIPIIIFFLLGIVLTIFTKKEILPGKQKKFLLLTGISATGFFVCIFLHNLIYGLLIYFFGQDFWQRNGMGDEPIFFIIAIFICPACLLLGIIGTIVIFVKRKK